MSDGDLSAQFMLEPGFMFAPDLVEVAALMRARLKVNGQQHDTFDGATRPTAAQASQLITTAASYVRGRVGMEIPEGLWATARHLTSLRAVMLIELSFFPEQTTEDASIYQTVSALFEQGMTGLIDSLGDIGEGPDNRIGVIPVTSPTLAAYQSMYGYNPNEWFPG